MMHYMSQETASAEVEYEVGHEVGHEAGNKVVL